MSLWLSVRTNAGMTLYLPVEALLLFHALFCLVIEKVTCTKSAIRLRIDFWKEERRHEERRVRSDMRLAPRNADEVRRSRCTDANDARFSKYVEEFETISQFKSPPRVELRKNQLQNWGRIFGAFVTDTSERTNRSGAPTIANDESIRRKWDLDETTHDRCFHDY